MVAAHGFIWDPCRREDWLFPENRMYTEKTPYSQIVDFVPWKTIHRLPRLN